jgi:hypothetical protein
MSQQTLETVIIVSSAPSAAPTWRPQPSCSIPASPARGHATTWSATGAKRCEPLEGQIFNVFTLRGRRITRIDDYRRRSEPVAAAGIAADVGWR